MSDTRMRSRLLPWAAIAVALIAVFVALGGPSYAGTIARRAVTADKVDGLPRVQEGEAGPAAATRSSRQAARLRAAAGRRKPTR